MAKHKKDIGLQYIQKLHLNQARSSEDLLRGLARKFGQERVLAFATALPGSERTERFYDAKNSDPAVSRAMSGSAEADAIRRCANYIHAHREVFGEEILEIGCDSGLSTGFLALEFPQCHITTIDRSANALKTTKTLLDDLGVTNVTLVHASLHDYVKDHPGKADTVLSMRVLKENYRDDIFMNEYQPLEGQLQSFLLPAGADYARDLSRAVRAGGTLVSIPYVPTIGAVPGWMMNLAALGWSIDQASCTLLPTVNPEGDLLLCGFTARTEETPDLQAWGSEGPSAEAKARMEQTLADWRSTIDLPVYANANYSGEKAQLFSAAHQGELLQGVGLFDQSGELSGKFGIYALRGFPKGYLTCHHLLDRIEVFCFPDGAQRERNETMLRMVRDGSAPGIGRILQELDLRARWMKTDPDTGMEVPAE